MEISNKAWSKIDRSKLPAECFFIVPDKEKRSTWRLPYREGCGNVDEKTGLYVNAGPVNINAVRAVLSAINVPDDIKENIKTVVKELGAGGFVEQMRMKAYFMMVLGEAFISLDQELRKAVREAFGSDTWLQDFSDSEVVFEMPVSENPSYGDGGTKKSVNRQIFALSYVITKDGQIIFGTEDPVPVEKGVIYEPIDTEEKLLRAVMDLLDGANVIEKTCSGKVGKFIKGVEKGVKKSGSEYNPYAVAVASAEKKFGVKKVRKTMGWKGRKVTKEELEAEQTNAEKHHGIEKRFKNIEAKSKGRKAYLAHRIAVKHAKMAQESEEMLDEYGVSGMKWGVQIGAGKLLQKSVAAKTGAAHGGAHIITTKVGNKTIHRITTVGKKALDIRLKSADKRTADKEKLAKARIPLGNLKGKELRQWKKVKGFTFSGFNK